MEALQEFVDSFTYLGFFRAPARQFESANPRGNALSGDMVRYWVGRHCGEQVLNWRLVRLVLSPARDPWLNAAYRRHAMKTAATARHVMGLRAVAFLTAGSAAAPPWSAFSWRSGWRTFFTDQIQAVRADVHRIERWLGLAGLLALGAVVVVGMWRWRRGGKERMDQGRAGRHSPTP